MTAVLDARPAAEDRARDRDRDWDLVPGLGELPGIDLDSLSQRAALMTRRDRKYLVDRDLLPDLVAGLHERAEVLQIDGRRQFGYESCYFDTPTLTSYTLAARRRPRRFKVRTRSYLDSGGRWLEVKVRDGRGRTRKSRIAWPPGAGSAGLGEAGAAFVTEQLAGTVAQPGPVVAALAATLTTQYLRTTLYLPADRARVTLDDRMSAWDRRGGEVVATGLAIVETKGAGPSCAADRLLWSLGQRPIRVSKYATSLAWLHPGLPATPWRPALRRLTAADEPRGRQS
ncbi:MAG: polyphosphate polymerase domain-containing protein [Candidatus Nanopelagicales bacterium]